MSDQFKVNRHLCSGIILNEFWILTAARCVHNVLPEQLSVRLNYDNDLLHMFDQPRIEVERSSFHSQFSEMPFRYVANDMALLKLRQPLEFNEQVQPACLLGLGYKAHGLGLNSTLVTAGWGSSSKVVFNALTEHRSPTNMTRQLKSVQLKDVSDNPASILHPNAVMYLERVNPQQPIVCDGDSGNPVMVDHENRTKVVSIMSYQVPSRSGTYEIEYGSGIYAAARISSYTNWLNLHIAQNYCNV